MPDMEPWNSGCLGCYQEAEMKRRGRESIQKEAEEYAKKNKTDVIIYCEGQEWKYYNAATAATIGIYHGEIIRFSEYALDGPVH